MAGHLRPPVRACQTHGMVDAEEAALAARARFEHVSTRGQELADAITSWMSKEPVKGVYTIADNRLSWELRWRLSPPPPESWGMILGDAAHNLRSAMDNLLHFIAEREGATPSQLGQVQFPVVSDPAKWKDAKRRISMLPERVQLAVESVQPFNRPEAERPTDGLAILSSVNNADKHRIALAGDISPQTMEHSFSVEFEDGASHAGPPRTIFHGGYIVDGGLILEHDTAPDRIKAVEGHASYGAQVVIVDEWGNSTGVTQLLAALLAYLPQVLDIVLLAWQRPTMSA